MSYAAMTSRYLDNDVLSRSPEWLVPLMFEHLLTSLRRAVVQIEAGDQQGREKSLEKAIAIVSELLATLDRENGGDIANGLSGLYSYFALEIMNVGRSGGVGSLPRLIPLIEELHEAWVQAAEEVAPRAAASRRRLAVSAA